MNKRWSADSSTNETIAESAPDPAAEPLAAGVPAVAAASSSRRGRALPDWSSFPSWG